MTFTPLLNRCSVASLFWRGLLVARAFGGHVCIYDGNLGKIDLLRGAHNGYAVSFNICSVWSFFSSGLKC